MFPLMFHIWQRDPNPPVLQDPPYIAYPTFFFKFCSNNTGLSNTHTHTHTHTHTPNTQRKIILEKVSMKISDTHLFKNKSPILATPPFLWEKSEPPLFSKIFKTQPPSL